MIIAWQPDTHKLTRSTFTVVELWDVDAQKLLKIYKGVSTFAWSPDEKYLATYNSPFTSPFPQAKKIKVTILDADTGVKVGLYTSQIVPYGVRVPFRKTPSPISLQLHPSSADSHIYRYNVASIYVYIYPALPSFAGFRMVSRTV